MRIDKLTIQNFRCFEEHEFSFRPDFNLFVGENGSGKTALLDTVAVALGAWTRALPQYDQCDIAQQDVRLKSFPQGDMITFEAQYPVWIQVEGTIVDQTTDGWIIAKYIDSNVFGQDTREGQTKFEEIGKGIIEAIRQGEHNPLPLIACYGAGRVWSNPLSPVEPDLNAIFSLSRLEGYRDCFHSVTNKDELNKWIYSQDAEAKDAGKETPTYRAFKQAVISCLPGAKDLSVSYKLQQAVIHFEGQVVPFINLSDGQRTMATLVGDIARRAITLNPWLGEQAIRETSGVVLIDELETHLHPKWQRHVAADLQRVFPKIQFFATTHSPEIISEIQPSSIIFLQNEGGKISSFVPDQAYGLDVNWILENLMGTSPRPGMVQEKINAVEDALENTDLDQAKSLLEELKKQLHGVDGEIVRLEATIRNLESLADEAYPEEL